MNKMIRNEMKSFPQNCLHAQMNSMYNIVCGCRYSHRVRVIQSFKQAIKELYSENLYWYNRPNIF